MKIFDKKLLIILIFLFIILCISIYFFTKEDNNDFISSSKLYILPSTNNSIEEINEIVIHIDGEVINPGIVYLPTEARVSDAIEASGGTTELADISKINLAYVLKDGQKIHIPSIYDTDSSQYIQDDAGINVIVSDNSNSSSLVNINLATQSELETLPGVGPSTASKIIDYRNKNGRFQTIEDIMNVSGIGDAKFANIKDYICI